ncbi:hypothetical protein [Fusobacterium periodonticum]|uniref:Uncharacterized protein n=1 Tax=Fusobacterium periodonticum ATCC 33693 TaxID=546275 RepID=D4CXM6_9FUSO|nr:hypothetical protein [Fusobacterium periodonticum]EFE85865.1 hypothetical protein FUSPEROL_02223 [Fusobacterium periodonticum ATCC 33693]
MKVIKLYGVHYLSQNGILLNSEKNFVEATEENILKLHKYIENKYVKVVELDENGKEIVEENRNEVIKEEIKELFEEKKDEKEVTEIVTEQTKENEEEENQSTEEEKSEKKSKKSSKK